MRINKEAVVRAAADIADKDGLGKTSLKAVAEKLSIRTPSLYNHIESLDDLLREVAHKGMQDMNSQMIQSAIGISGDAAIQSVCAVYFRFAAAHPGVYETIQWAVWHGTDETSRIFGEYKSLLTTLILSCGLKKQGTNEILNLLIGVLHGYTTLHLSFAILNPEQAQIDLCNAIDTVLLGIRQKYHNN